MSGSTVLSTEARIQHRNICIHVAYYIDLSLTALNQGAHDAKSCLRLFAYEEYEDDHTQRVRLARQNDTSEMST